MARACGCEGNKRLRIGHFPLASTGQYRRCLGQRRPSASASRTNGEQGDVPGWVLVTLMTAGLIIAIWAVAGPALVNLFNTAIEKVAGLL